MANTTTAADFVGQNNIPDKDLISENLTAFINKYEPALFDRLLGTALYTLFKATPADARFVALLPYLKPASVDYTYWFYLEDQGVQLTSMGASQAKKTNAIPVSPYGKMVRAWNEMVNYNRNLHKYIKDNASTYPEYTIEFPDWFFSWAWFGYWGYGFFDWQSWWDEDCIPEIYRYKNRLGI